VEATEEKGRIRIRKPVIRIRIKKSRIRYDQRILTEPDGETYEKMM
jgi:hypothetical protein